MSFVEDLRRWARGEDDDMDDLDDFDNDDMSVVDHEPHGNTRAASNKVVNINATTQLSVVLVKPEKFENASEVANHLRERRTVVLNLEQTNKDQARRMIDFLSGVTYALDGKIKKVANSTFILTPFNVTMIGDLLDELENNGLYI